MFTTWFVENLSSIKQQIIMVTLNFKILPNRRKASNKLGIYLAVSHKKETRYITTEFESMIPGNPEISAMMSHLFITITYVIVRDMLC